MHTDAAKTHAFAIAEVLVLLQLALALQFPDLRLFIDHIPSAYGGYYYSMQHMLPFSLNLVQHAEPGVLWACMISFCLALWHFAVSSPSEEQGQI